MARLEFGKRTKFLPLSSLALRFALAESLILKV